MIYGKDVECTSLIPKRSWVGPWNGVIHSLHHLRKRARGFHLQSHCPIKMGDESLTSFWHDVWIDNVPLYMRYHKIFFPRYSYTFFG